MKRKKKHLFGHIKTILWRNFTPNTSNDWIYLLHQLNEIEYEEESKGSDSLWRILLDEIGWLNVNLTLKLASDCS